MRICLVGEFSGNLDEAMRIVTSQLDRELSKRHEVLRLDVKKAFPTGFRKDIKQFHPQIVHYLPGPTIISLAMMKLIHLHCRESRTVMFAMHPGFHGLRGLSYGPSYALSTLTKPLLPLFKPDLMLTQSPETEKMFADAGYKTMFFPCGVDTEKFAPVTRENKGALRQKYGLDEKEFVLLHVGSIKRRRNVQILQKLAEQDVHVVVVAATSTGVEKGTEEELERSGCSVWKKYVPNIEEVYALADCYVFPTVKTVGAIEFPLSVLEAMSCNLPVMCTRFGGLPRAFQEGDGLFFVSEEDDFVRGLNSVRNGLEIKTREKVLPYSWEKVTSRLVQIYQELTRQQ